MLVTAVWSQVLKTRGVARHLLATCLNASRGSPAKVLTPALTVRGSSSPRPAISVWVITSLLMGKIHLKIEIMWCVYDVRLVGFDHINNSSSELESRPCLSSEVVLLLNGVLLMLWKYIGRDFGVHFWVGMVRVAKKFNSFGRKGSNTVSSELPIKYWIHATKVFKKEIQF